MNKRQLWNDLNVDPRDLNTAHHQFLEGLNIREEEPSTYTSPSSGNPTHFGLLGDIGLAIFPWVMAIMIGCLTAMTGAYIHINAAYLFDLKEGYCWGGLLNSRTQCCGGPDYVDLQTNDCSRIHQFLAADLPKQGPFCAKFGGMCWIQSQGLGNFFQYLSLGVMLPVLSSYLVVHFSKSARGSGIPEVKAVVAGFVFPAVFTFQTLVIKSLGLILVVGAGLALGKEGPLVQIGAGWASVIAHVQTKFVRQCRLFFSNPWGFLQAKPFESVEYGYIEPIGKPLNLPTARRRGPVMGGLAQTFIPHHELICVGAAAGVATAFNAPLGGVLFVIEELGTGRSSGGGLSKRVLLLCFVSTFSATFAIKYMDLNSTNEMLLFSSSAETKKKEWKAWEVIPFSCLGIVAGIVGTLFIKANLWVSERRRRMEKKGRLWCLPDSAIQHELWQKMLPTAFLRWAEVWVPSQSEPFGEDTAHLRPSLISVVEVFLIAVFTGITNYMHPSLKPLSFTTIGALLEACPNEKIQAFGFCVEQSDGHSNLGGNVFEKFKLFGIVGGAFIIRFAQTVITFGSMIPAGLFIPSLFIGACLGRGVGHFVRWNGETNDQAHVEPGIYAAVGAVAMLAGFTRMTVSLVVIMFEITGGVENIIPFMIAVFIAKRVGDCLSNGIYESHMQLQGMPVVDPPSNFRVGHLTISDLTDYSEFVFVASPQATYTVDQVITCLENDRPCVVLDEDEQLVGVIIDNPSVLDHLSLLDVGSYRAVFDDHHHVLAENTICIAQFVCKNVIEMAGDAPVLTAYRAFAEQPDLQAIISYSTYEEDCNRIFVLSKLGFARKMINSGEVPLVSCISHKMFRKDPDDQESRS